MSTKTGPSAGGRALVLLAAILLSPAPLPAEPTPGTATVGAGAGAGAAAGAGEAAPSGPGFDLGDLVAGSRRLVEMEAAFAKVEAYAQGDATAEFKAAAWGRFLEAYAEDVAGSRMDDLMRESAGERKARWERSARELEDAWKREDEQRREAAEAERIAAEEEGAPQEAGRDEEGPLEAGKDWTEAVSGIEMIWIPAGTFPMGSNQGERDEKPVHPVRLAGFWLAKSEVTQGQWRRLMGNNPSYFVACGDACPVENVSWDDAREFLHKLADASGKAFRLPTEAEWEYAARSGNPAERWAGTRSVSEIGEYAWYRENSGSRTHPACTKLPNDFGLCDMTGNVWEWVADWYGPYVAGEVEGPTGPAAGAFRIRRGGGWLSAPTGARTAYRRRNSPGNRFAALGFRPALSAGAP